MEYNGPYSCDCSVSNPAFSWDDHDHGDDFWGHGCGSDSYCSCTTKVDKLDDICEACEDGEHIFQSIPCDD